MAAKSSSIKITGSVIVAGALALTAFTAWQANQKASDTHAAIQELTSTVAAMSQSSQGVGSEEEFQAAVTRSIEAFITNAERQQVEARFSVYELAPEEPIDGKWIYGNAQARFTLVEFADTECGYCKQFHDTPKSIVDASNGNVNWEYKHLAILGDASVRQAEAAECVGEQLGNRAFWTYLHEIYQATSSGGRGAGDLAALAGAVGADTSEFRSCLSEGRYRDQIQQDAALARSQGITGTPATMVVDNQTGNAQLLGGAQPAQAFLQVIRRMMSEEQETGQTAG